MYKVIIKKFHNIINNNIIKNNNLSKVRHESNYK
jgi:hypothetical protein